MKMQVAKAGYAWSVEHSPELNVLAGRWVALGGKGVIAVNASLARLMKNVAVKKTTPFFTRIPTKEEIVFYY